MALSQSVTRLSSEEDLRLLSSSGRIKIPKGTKGSNGLGLGSVLLPNNEKKILESVNLLQQNGSKSKPVPIPSNSIDSPAVQPMVQHDSLGESTNSLHERITQEVLTLEKEELETDMERPSTNNVNTTKLAKSLSSSPSLASKANIRNGVQRKDSFDEQVLNLLYCVPLTNSF
jgi:hypothetical protein